MHAIRTFALRLAALSAGLSALAACSQPVASSAGVLATPPGLAQNLTASNGYVYWAASDGAATPTWSIDRVDESGGAVEQVATRIAPPNGLAVDGIDAYWTSDDGVLRAVPVSGLAPGAAPRVIASNLGSPGSLAVVGGSAYVMVVPSYAMALEKIPLDGTPPTTIASGGLLTSLVTDGEAVYFAQVDPTHDFVGTVWRYATGDASPEKVLSPSVPVLEIAIGGGNLYAEVGDPTTQDRLSDITSVPLTGGAPATLASGVKLNVLGASSASVYWSTTSAVWTVQSKGGTATQVSSDGVSSFASEAGRLFAVRFDAQAGTQVVAEND